MNEQVTAAQAALAPTRYAEADSEANARVVNLWEGVDPAIAAIASTETVPRVFWRRVNERGTKVAMRKKYLGIWRPITWRTYGENVKLAGLGFAALGLGQQDVVSIISNGNPEWLYCDFGIQAIGGIGNGVYTTDSEKQVSYILNDSKTRVCVVENDEQLDKVLSVRHEIPALQKIVVIDPEGLHHFADPMVMNFEDLLELGRKFERQHEGFWETALQRGKSEDTAILMYTSGTTGAGKGVMLSHRNLLFKMENEVTIMPQIESDELLSFLPLSHIAERSLAALGPLKSGCTINFVESADTLVANLQELQPTVILAVPRYWEKFHSGVVVAMKDGTWVGKLAYRLALSIGYRMAKKRVAKKRPSLQLSLGFKLADLLVFSNIKRHIGISRCRYLLTGAAPIAPDVINWYLALGMDMREAYGQTESSGMISGTPFGSLKLGTVGRPLANTQVRIGDRGEILVRGPHVFSRYLNLPEKTAQTVVDGWLHTGDVGRFDEDGWLYVTDRLKDIIITAGGKNVAPSEIENKLKFSPYITDAVVIGDRRKYLTCLIMIDHENVVQHAQNLSVPFTNFTSLCKAREVQELIGREVEKVNQELARVETIKKFRLIDQALTAEDEELTATMKLKRKLVNEKYAALINEMYQEE